MSNLVFDVGLSRMDPDRTVKLMLKVDTQSCFSRENLLLCSYKLGLSHFPDEVFKWALSRRIDC